MEQPSTKPDSRWIACRSASPPPPPLLAAHWALALLLIACGGASPERGEKPDDSGAAENSPQEPPTPGGETGSFDEPDTCELTAAPISRATAESLGFAALLERVEGTWDVPLQWDLNWNSEWEQTGAAPPSGYDESTRAVISTTLVQIAHSAVEGCAERLRMGLLASFESADGALRFQAQLLSNVSDPTPSIFAAVGIISLDDAEGSLRLHPPREPCPTALDGGSSGPAKAGATTPSEKATRQTSRRDTARLALAFSSDGVRGQLEPRVSCRSFDSANFGGFDGYDHAPLSARFPIDHCGYAALPLAPDEIGSMPGGRSVAERLDALQGERTEHPARWGDGATTRVRTRLGAPSEICVSQEGTDRRLTATLPIDLSTEDGRLRVARTGSSTITVDASGEIVRSRIQVGHDALTPSEALSVAEFAAQTNVSDWDWGGIETLSVWRSAFTVNRGSLAAREVRASGPWIVLLQWPDE